MNNYDHSVMIALLPTTREWCNIDLPHLTLAYVGEIEDLKPTTFNELVKVALTLALSSSPISLNIIGFAVFGDAGEKVDVLLTEKSPELLAMRSIVEKWNASKHDFNPHVTVGPEGSSKGIVPNDLLFDRILVSWGNKNVTYKFMY